MGVIGWIIVIIFGLGLIVSLFEWIMDHLVQVLLLLVTIIGLIFWTKGTVIVTGVLVLSYGIYLLINNNFRDLFSEHKRTKIERAEKKKQNDEIKRKELEYEAKVSDLPESVKFVITEINSFKKKLEVFRKDISDSEMRLALDDLEKTIDDLSSKLIDNPSNGSKLQKMANYYLPTISKLLEKYLVYNGLDDEKSRMMAGEIKQSVSTLDRAMEKLLQEINTTEDWDVLADISVMKTMIDRDGLSSDEIRLGKDGS